jgi:proteic killer suppression protein
LAILSFGDAPTADLFHGRDTKQARRIPKQIHKVALRKLDMVNAAAVLSDLRSPPNNKLEALKDDLAGYHSIRVNDQYRVIFKWTDQGATEVRVADYH